MYDYILNGDSAELLKTLPDNSIDMVLTSPPYDNLRTYNGFVFDFETIARELYRVVKTGGVVAWIVSDAVIDGGESGSSFRQALFFQKIGFLIYDTMIWFKNCCSFNDYSRYHQAFEYMFIFSKGKPKTFNRIEDRLNQSYGQTIHGTKREKDGTLSRLNNEGNKIEQFGARYNVWQIAPERQSLGHPAVFPLALAKDLIISYSQENDIVLDVFLGSGTTAAAALLTRRHYIGFEISEEYIKIAQKRITDAEKESKQIDIFHLADAEKESKQIDIFNLN